MTLLVPLLIATALAVFVIAPLLSTGEAGEVSLPVDVTPATDLRRRRMAIYENVRDLDFDHQSGKISADDYQALRRGFISEAAQLMLSAQESGAESVRDAYIERQVAARRKAEQALDNDAYVCPECGFHNAVPVKFCGECGARIAARK